MTDDVIRKPMTPEGYTILANEHTELTSVTRPEVVAAIQVAAAEGDRSENAEYIYGKKRLREIDKRIRYLDRILKDVVLVDPIMLRGERVCVGSTVHIEDEEGQCKQWKIVGEGEADLHKGGISWKSPVARALLGKRVGDVVFARRPSGEIELEIVDLFFGKRHWQEDS